MNTKKKCKALCVASALMVLLGIVRGIGGFMDLTNDQVILNSFNTNQTALVVMAVVFILLTAAVFIAAIEVYEQNTEFFLYGAVLIVLYIINGFVCATFLFDNYTSIESFYTMIAGIVIITLLILGKRSLNKIEESESETTIDSNPEMV
ncbi:MAG: hypothetical protein WAU11_09795 [Ignavibacteriaceae bacterium]|jgi:hypothetical protein